MARESKTLKVERARLITDILARTYPDVHCELDHSNPLELLIATILSAQCTDERVNQVTARLFKRYRTPSDFASAPVAEMEEAIKPTGFFRNKTKSVQACCRALIERHGGGVPKTMEELTALGGVGRKTANVVLGNAFGINAGVVVDTHVGRLSKRMAFSSFDDAEKVERDLMKLIPQEQWTDFSHLLIWHGRRRCYARKPDCEHCEVLRYCPRVGVKSPRPQAGKP